MKTKIIVLIFTLFIFCVCKLSPATDNSAYIEVSNIDNAKTFKGYIKQKDIQKLSFDQEGKISFLPYSKGDFIRKGQVIARLDGIFYKIKKEKFNLDNEINYNIILAPYDCYINEIYKKQGQYVKNKETVLSIQQSNKTEAEILIEPEYINKINLKKTGVLEYKNAKYEVKISNISKNDNNYLIELQLNDIYKELKEGSNINVKLDLSQ